MIKYYLIFDICFFYNKAASHLYISVRAFFLYLNNSYSQRAPPIFYQFFLIGGNVEHRPKRRKKKDNPYVLTFDKKNKRYFVSFNDGQNNHHIVEIDKLLYEAFDRFELDDLSELNEYDNHIEHSEMIEQTLYKRAIKKQASIDDIVDSRLNNEYLNNLINNLPYIQRKRLIKYYFYGKTFEEIAKEENCTKRAIKFSVDIAIKKIQKNFKNRLHK